MATPKFIIEVKAKGFESLKDQLNGSNKAFQRFGDNAKRSRRATAGFERGMGALRNTMLLYAFAVGVATKATGAFVRNASKFQDVRTRLVGLTGSVVRANRAFDTFNQVASTTPFALDDVVNAGAQLKAFGADAEELIVPITDLAAFMGTTATEAANSFGRAFAGGAGAADILRERGILNIIKSSQGIADLSKITLPQFREALITSLQDPAIGVAGSSDRMSQTFTGAMSNMGDSLTRLTATVGDIALPTITSFIKGVENTAKQLETLFKDLTESSAEKTLRKLKEINVEAEALTDLEILVFKDQSAQNIKLLNDQIAKLINTDKGLRDIFDLFGDFERKQIGASKVFGNTFENVKNVTISQVEAGKAIEHLTKLVNQNIAASIQAAKVDGEVTDVQATLVEGLNEETLGFISLISILQQSQVEHQRLANAIAELTTNANEVTVTAKTFEEAIKGLDGTGKFALRTFNRFGDAFAEAALTAKSFEEAGRNAVRAVAAEILSKAATFGLMKLFFATPLKGLSFGQFLLGSLGIKHDGGPVQKFATGGMIQGRDNVPILAEAGEFVIKRDSAQSIGLSALNQMNETGQVASNINVHIHGGIVQEDYVTNELIPAINRSKALA
jgi:hypothetical protein